MTFVRTKLALEQLAVGQVLNIRLRDGEPRHNVPRAVRDHGHEILSLSRARRRSVRAARPQAALSRGALTLPARPSSRRRASRAQRMV